MLNDQMLVPNVNREQQQSGAAGGFSLFYPTCDAKLYVKHILTVIIFECGASGESLMEIRSVVWSEVRHPPLRRRRLSGHTIIYI